MERKVGGDGGGEVEGCAGGGVGDGELPGVEELAREVGAAAVGAVAGDGVAEVFEMDTDLVGAAGFWAALEEGEFAFDAEEAP